MNDLEELGVTDVINSPTLPWQNEYRCGRSRELIYTASIFTGLKNWKRFYDMGYEDYFYSGALCFIEWPKNNQGTA